MEKTVRLLKALADKTRLRILSLLLNNGELCVCDIIATLKLPQSTTSRHLAYLKKTGWVEDRRCGLWIYYSVKNNGDALYLELVALLQRNLAALPAVKADRERLAGFCRRNNCA